MSVALNIDLGELPAEPEEFYRLAHWANVACGGHAGDADSMRRALEQCQRFGARPGAHPSYADRDHFGRRALALSAAEVHAQVRGQIAELAHHARHLGLELHHVKAHGALYHALHTDLALAAAYLDGVAEALGDSLVVVGLARSTLDVEARRRGWTFAREQFADRAIDANGRLVPRGQPGAVIEDPEMAARKARLALTNEDCETLCVHGDTHGAVELARAVRRILDGSR